MDKNASKLENDRESNNRQELRATLAPTALWGWREEEQREGWREREQEKKGRSEIRPAG